MPDVTKEKPEWKLTVPYKKKSGRNFQGQITALHRGGGFKRRFRLVDFKRTRFDIPARVLAVEYDPNRSALLALIQYENGDKSYILHPEGLKAGHTVISSKERVEVSPGNAMPLEKMPLGTFVHNVEVCPGKGGQMVRSAGGYAQLMALEGDFAVLRLPSGEMRKILKNCMGSVGQVGNLDHENIHYGSAGRMRRLGRRPRVRGVAMNIIDHPHGGGKGKSKGGNIPQSPTGVPAKGYKTRQRKKVSSRFIIKRRK
ncbi:MAG TPA: 50S ribosomal protein L2 [bacterium]|nr:50S ribosomal protein L2 [bacterium]